MRRCPQCDFVYENDQTLCDMDGSELISAPTSSLPLLANAALHPPSRPAKARRKRRALLPLTALICGAVLCSIYFLFTYRAAPRQSYRPAVITTAELSPKPEQMRQEPSPLPTPVPAPHVTVAKTAHRTAPFVRPAPQAPTPPAAREEKQPEPSSAKQKKESAFVSLLKKTGRVLKKPFQH
jgi:hypothetical protein